MADHGPLAAVNRTPIADVEARELADTGIADDELMQAPLKHPPPREAHLREIFSHGRSRSDQRKKDSVAGYAPAAFDGNLGVEHYNGLALGTLADARQLEHSRRFLPGNVALKYPLSRSGQYHAVVAHAAHLLSARASAHRQHGNQHTDRAGDTDDDGQDRRDPLGHSRQIHEQYAEKLPDEVHWSAQTPREALHRSSRVKDTVCRGQ